MRTAAEWDELKVPEWALSLLINGDASGLDDAEERMVDEWASRFYRRAAELGGHVVFEVGEGRGFTWRPEFGLACDCADVTVLVLTSGAACASEGRAA